MVVAIDSECVENAERDRFGFIQELQTVIFLVLCNLKFLYIQPRKTLRDHFKMQKLFF